MFLGLLGKGISRIIPSLVKGVSAGFGLFKRALPKIISTSKKVADIASTVSSGIKVAKEIPLIGEKIKKTEEQLGIEKKADAISKAGKQISMAGKNIMKLT